MKIPLCSNAKDAEPLQRCLDQASDRLGMSPYLVATVLLVFLEALIYETCRNKCVKIPGFGMFFPRKSEYTKPPGCVPSFEGARGWRNEMKVSCPPTDFGKREAARYRHNGSSRAAMALQRPCTTMAQALSEIKNEAKRNGCEVPEIKRVRGGKRKRRR